MNIIRFLKDWTLPVAITVGTVCYLTFCYVPQLDAIGDTLGPVFDTLFPLFVFLTLFVTFCKVDFHEMRPHRWHVGVLVAQLLLVAVNIGVIFHVEADAEQKLLWEAMLTCIIGPSAAAAPVVTGKLGGNISTMTTYTLISSLASALLIPLVFPILEQTVHVSFLTAFLIILQKVSIVLLLPLVLGWTMQHYVKGLCRRIAAMPNLSFYLWSVSLSITTGITVKNIVHSEATVTLLLMIAVCTFVLCFVQFGELVQKAESPYVNDRPNTTPATRPDPHGDVEVPTPKQEEPKLDPRASFPGMSQKDDKATAPHSAAEASEGFKAGQPDGNTKEGRTTGNANAHLQGRNVVGTLPKPSYNAQMEGTVVVQVKVDQYGNVTEAIPGVEGTTVTDKSLWNAARAAAMKAHFNMSADAPVLQTGTITYKFKLQ